MKLTGKLTRKSKSLNAALSPRSGGGGRVQDVVYGSAAGESLVNPEGVAIIPPYPTIPTSNKSIFGTTEPLTNIGNNGDIYFEMSTKTYYAVDYVSTSGGNKTQCIKTGIKMDENTSIYIKTKIHSDVFANYQSILAWRNTIPWYALYTRFNNQNVFGFEYINNAQSSDNPPIYDKVIEINADKNGWSWSDGITTGSIEGAFSGVTTEGLNLGSSDFSGAGNNEQGKYDFYEVIFYRNNIEIMHLVPAIENNIAGMIDLLTYEFYKSNDINNNFTYSGTPTEVSSPYVKKKYVKYNNEWIEF